MQLLDVRADHLELVQRILQQHVPDAEVWAFGSRAKWLARDSSDLDLCIRAAAALSFEQMGLLREALKNRICLTRWTWWIGQWRVQRFGKLLSGIGWWCGRGVHRRKGRQVNGANFRSRKQCS